MRYTTVIDVSEITEVYRNPAAVRLYIHMALTCGYHDYDRDIYTGSVRRLMGDLGLTLSATRHALKILTRHNLIKLQGGVYIITKYIPAETITPRPKTARQAKLQAEAQRREAIQAERDNTYDRMRREREALQAQGKSSWMVYYEGKARLAQAGDREAARWCERNKAEYERQAKQVADNNRK